MTWHPIQTQVCVASVAAGRTHRRKLKLVCGYHSAQRPPDLRPTVSGVTGARPPTSVLCKMQRGAEPAAARRTSEYRRGAPHPPTSSRFLQLPHHRPCSHTRCQPLPTAHPACDIPGSLWTACKKHYMPDAQLGLVDSASGHTFFCHWCLVYCSRYAEATHQSTCHSSTKPGSHTAVGAACPIVTGISTWWKHQRAMGHPNPAGMCNG